jgi:hypothetical protein
MAQALRMPIILNNHRQTEKNQDILTVCREEPPESYYPKYFQINTYQLLPFCRVLLPGSLFLHPYLT